MRFAPFGIRCGTASLFQTREQTLLRIHDSLMLMCVIMIYANCKKLAEPEADNYIKEFCLNTLQNGYVIVE